MRVVNRGEMTGGMFSNANAITFTPLPHISRAPTVYGLPVGDSWEKSDMHIAGVTLGVAHLQPLVALVAGVLILIVPRLLNYIVAIFLILSGLLGLGFIR